jgi:hypothetical protein
MSLLAFPGMELLDYVARSFNALKLEQARLLGQSRRPANRP